MNLPDPDDSTFAAWAQQLPRPALSAAARARSLAAATAALSVPAASPPVRRRWFLNVHTTGLAACWLLIACLKWNSPPSPNREDAGAPAMAAQPPPDSETATLLASLYPNLHPDTARQSFRTPF